MARRLFSYKPLAKSMITKFTIIYALLRLNGLISPAIIMCCFHNQNLNLTVQISPLMYITTKVLFHRICAIDLIMEDGALFFCDVWINIIIMK